MQDAFIPLYSSMFRARPVSTCLFQATCQVPMIIYQPLCYSGLEKWHKSREGWNEPTDEGGGCGCWIRQRLQFDGESGSREGVLVQRCSVSSVPCILCNGDADREKCGRMHDIQGMATASSPVRCGPLSCFSSGWSLVHPFPKVYSFTRMPCPRCVPLVLLEPYLKESVIQDRSSLAGC